MIFAYQQKLAANLFFSQSIMLFRACAHCRVSGGAGRDRTDDLKLAKLPLSQLSYGPIFSETQQTRDWLDHSAGKLGLKAWWAWVDSNYRPHAYQACALTGLSYRPPRLQKCRQPKSAGQTLVRVHSIGERETKAAMPRVVLSKLRSKQKRFVSNLLF